MRPVLTHRRLGLQRLEQSQLPWARRKPDLRTHFQLAAMVRLIQCLRKTSWSGDEKTPCLLFGVGHIHGSGGKPGSLLGWDKLRNQFDLWRHGHHDGSQLVTLGGGQPTPVAPVPGGASPSLTKTSSIGRPVTRHLFISSDTRKCLSGLALPDAGLFNRADSGISSVGNLRQTSIFADAGKQISCA